MKRYHVAILSCVILMALSCVHVRPDEPGAPAGQAFTPQTLQILLGEGKYQQALEGWVYGINQEAPASRGADTELRDLRAALMASYGSSQDLAEKAVIKHNLQMLHNLGPQAGDTSPAGEAWVAELAEVLLAKGNLQAARGIVHELDPEGLLSGPGYAPLRTALEQAQALAAAASPSAVLTATVTIWVDKGIRMSRGYGIPDRVLGSGFFVEKNGYVITNHHVISSEVDPEYEGYSRLYIRIQGRKSEKIPAKVVGWCPELDIALLKTEVDAPATVDLFADRPRGLEPGDRVFALGSPGGLENTLTAGVVSSLGRRLLSVGEVIQIDAPVNPGNSGGPLVDENGTLAGLVFAGLESFEGVNFALSARYLRQILPRLATEGKVEIPWLGMALAEYRNELVCTFVVSGSPAWRAGIKPGDRIQEINGAAVASLIEAQDRLLAYRPGMIVRLTCKTGAGTRIFQPAAGPGRDVWLVAGKRPEHPFADDAAAGFSLAMLPGLFGFSAEYAGKDLGGIPLAVTEVEPGSTADESGIGEGDTMVLVGWNQYPKEHLVSINLRVRRQSHAYFENSLTLASYDNTPNFL